MLDHIELSADHLWRDHGLWIGAALACRHTHMRIDGNAGGASSWRNMKFVHRSGHEGLSLLQDILKEPAYRQSTELWVEFIDWQKQKVLGGLRSLRTVLDIRRTYSEALKVITYPTHTQA